MTRPSSAQCTCVLLAGLAFADACRPRALLGALAFAAAITVNASAWAGVYKCARDDGSVTYQEDPCPEGRELRDFDRDPPTVSVVPFRIVPGTGTRVAVPHASPAAREPKSRKGVDRPRNAAERKFLVPGIGEGEVVARIGRPDMSSGAGRKTMRWTYLPAPEDPQTVTTLTFELGRLIEVERKVVPK